MIGSASHISVSYWSVVASLGFKLKIRTRLNLVKLNCKCQQLESGVHNEFAGYYANCDGTQLEIQKFVHVVVLTTYSVMKV